MGIEENKQMVKAYWDALSDGELEKVMSLTTDDFVTWVPGPKD